MKKKRRILLVLAFLAVAALFVTNRGMSHNKWYADMDIMEEHFPEFIREIETAEFMADHDFFFYSPGSIIGYAILSEEGYQYLWDEYFSWQTADKLPTLGHNGEKKVLLKRLEAKGHIDSQEKWRSYIDMDNPDKFISRRGQSKLFLADQSRILVYEMILTP